MALRKKENNLKGECSFLFWGMSELTEQIIAKLQDKAIPEKAAFFPRFFRLDRENMAKAISFSESLFLSSERWLRW